MYNINVVRLATNTVGGKILRKPTIAKSNSITLMKGKTKSRVDSQEEAPFSPASLRDN